MVVDGLELIDHQDGKWKKEKEQWNWHWWVAVIGSNKWHEGLKEDNCRRGRHQGTEETRVLKDPSHNNHYRNNIWKNDTKPGIEIFTEVTKDWQKRENGTEEKLSNSSRFLKYPL